MSLWKRICNSAELGQPEDEPWHRRKPPTASLLTLAVAACLALGAAALPATALAARMASASATARAAKTLQVSDKGQLHLANPNSASSTLIEEGKITGTLPGSVRASLTIGTSTVKVGFTIYLHGGTITGRGTAKFNAGQGEFASFGGSISVSHGSGHYAHAKGTGQVYGTINRNTDNATVQVIGQLHL
jgi:hypothetical protein